VRPFLVVLLFGGCLGGTLDANSRPAVTPKLSELPDDPGKRDAVLDQSHEAAGPEHRKGMTKKERKVETMAAFAAAIVGGAFSKTQNVTLGTQTTVDENHLFEKTRPTRPSGSGSGDHAGSAATPEPAPDASQLTPWVKLK
jgi:hypothetical protein